MAGEDFISEAGADLLADLQAEGLLSKTAGTLPSDDDFGTAQSTPGEEAPSGQVESGLGNDRDLSALYALPVDVSIVLGKTSLQVSDILLIGQGSVIELDRLVGEDLDIYVNGKALARGTIVLSNDQFGCRINHILTPTERLQKIIMEK